MNPTKANTINGLVLVILGFLNYISSATPSTIVLIPSIFGIIFIATTPVLKKDNKWLYFSIIGLNFLLLGLLSQQLIQVLNASNEIRVLSRLATMLFSCLVATFVFVKYYLDNRWRL